MLHTYTGATLLPHDVHFWYYALVFWIVCVAISSCASRGATLVAVAGLSFALHLKASLDRMLATSTLAGYGALIAFDPESAPVQGPPGWRTGKIVDASWCWVHSLPVVLHNLSALEDFYTEVYVSVAVGLFVCGGACVLLCEDFSTNACRYPGVFASVMHHTGLCLWARSWICLAVVWPVHLLFVLEGPGGLTSRVQQDDLAKVGDASYQQWRSNTSPWIPVPEKVYSQLPQFVKIYIFYENFG